MMLPDALLQCIETQERETAREGGLAEEILREWLLPRYGPALRRLRAERQGRSQRTAAQYRSRFDLFSEACGNLGYSALPAEPEVVALFLMAMVDLGKPVQRLRDMKAAIAWKHREFGLPDPTEVDLVDVVIAEAKPKLNGHSNGKLHGHGHGLDY